MIEPDSYSLYKVTQCRLPLRVVDRRQLSPELGCRYALNGNLFQQFNNHFAAFEIG